MLTAEQHERVAGWLVYRGAADSLPEARNLLDRAIAHTQGKREAQAERGEAERETTGVAIVDEAEKLLAVRGVAASDYEAVAEAYEEVDAGRTGSEPGIPSKRSTPVAQLARERLVDHHLKALAAADGKSIETEADYLHYYTKADNEIPVLVEGGQS